MNIGDSVMPSRHEIKAEIAECVRDIFGAHAQSKADAAAERVLLSFKGKGWEVIDETSRSPLIRSLTPR